MQISDLVPCPASGQTQAAQCQHRIGLALSKAFVEDRDDIYKTGRFLRHPVQAAVRRLWHNDVRLLASAAAAAKPGGAAELADDNESLVTVMI